MFSQPIAEVKLPSALEGEYTDEMLSEMGIDSEQIQRLREQGGIA